jgi:phosphatidylglycerophosphatase A
LNSEIYAAKFGEIDHPSIVLDEVVGQIIALQIGFSFYHDNYFSLKFAGIHILISFIFNLLQ